jgi:hypothetical protein
VWLGCFFGPDSHMVGPTGGGVGIEVRKWTACVGSYVGAAGLFGLCLLGPLAGLLYPGQGVGAPSRASGQREDLPTPLEVVQRFFDILARTGFTPYFGSIGSKGDYLAAYALLSPRYQAEVPFDRFHESFLGVAAIEVLRLVLLPGAGARRLVFVELRTLEEVGPGRLSPDPIGQRFGGSGLLHGEGPGGGFACPAGYRELVGPASSPPKLAPNKGHSRLPPCLAGERFRGGSGRPGL